VQCSTSYIPEFYSLYFYKQIILKSPWGFRRVIENGLSCLWCLVVYYVWIGVPTWGNDGRSVSVVSSANYQFHVCNVLQFAVRATSNQQSAI
jgi:hypothetical protein